MQSDILNKELVHLLFLIWETFILILIFLHYLFSSYELVQDKQIDGQDPLFGIQQHSYAYKMLHVNTCSSNCAIVNPKSVSYNFTKY